MRTTAISDDDSLIGQLKETDVDLLLVLGDLYNTTIEKAAARYGPKRSFGVRGNHDTDAPFPPIVTPLHCTVETFQGMTFAGFGGSWRYKLRGHHLYEQEEVSHMLRTFPRVDVFIAHNSPRGIHERDNKVHQGFEGFLEYIERARPAYFIHGHQHFRGTTRYKDTQVIGVYGETIISMNPDRYST